MLVAVKQNREVQITDDEKELYFNNGFDIVKVENGKSEVIMACSEQNRIQQLEKEIAQLKSGGVKIKPAKENQMDDTEDREYLMAKAKELGLNVAHNIGLDTLKERIAEAEQE